MASSRASRPILPLQVAAVCYRRQGGRVEFLLVNTNGGNKWTLTHWTRGDLDSKRGTGELFDNQALATYEMFYEAKKMIEGPSGLPAPRKPDYDMDLKPVGTDSVGGIQCDLIPVEFAGPGMKQRRVGYTCVARDYGLLLRQETRHTKPDGTAIHSLLEMYDLKLNVPPDNNEFGILRTFTVLKKADTKPLPSMPD